MRKKTSHLIIVALTVAAIALTTTTYAAITQTKSFESSGTVTTSPNLAVYSDSGCTNTLSTINWGSIAAGSNVSRTIYLKNTGTGTLTLSSLTVSGWSPSNANNYITLNWDKQGTALSANQSIATMLTLTVSSSITGITDFNNNITISATG